MGWGRSLRTQARENCASDVQALVSFMKEAPAGIGASGATGSMARLAHVPVSTAADRPSSLAAGAWVHWLPPTRKPRQSSHLLPTLHPHLLPLPHLRAPQQLQDRACKSGSKWADLGDGGPVGMAVKWAFSSPSSLLKSSKQRTVWNQAGLISSLSPATHSHENWGKPPG